MFRFKSALAAVTILSLTAASFAYTPPGSPKKVPGSGSVSKYPGHQPTFSQPIRLGIVGDLNAGGGMYISRIIDGYPAQQVGLEAGDVIISVNGRLIRSHDDMRFSLDEAQGQNGHLTIVILSGTDGAYYQVDADLAVVHYMAPKGVHGMAKDKAAPATVKASNITKKRIAKP